MSLFKLPERKEKSANDILSTLDNNVKPKVVLKGTSLLATVQGIIETVESNLGDIKDDFELITTYDRYAEYCRNAVIDGVVAVDTETTGVTYLDQANMVGLCLYSPSQKPAYVSVGHISIFTEQRIEGQLTYEEIAKGIELLTKCKVIYHNAYFDMVVIKLCTGIWLEPYFDTMPASFLLDENNPHGLKYLYDKYVLNNDEKKSSKFAELFQGIPICYIPPDIAGIYGAHDSLMTYELYKFFEPFLTKGAPECEDYSLSGVSDIFWDEEMKLIPLLVRMKYNGINIDIERGKELAEKYEKLKKEAEDNFLSVIGEYKEAILKVAQETGEIEYPINYNSPKQMQIFIYDILKSGVIFRKEPRGTGKNVLNAVLTEKKWEGTPTKEVFIALAEVKKYDKVLNSFIYELMNTSLKYNGKIHCDLNSCRPRTGRFSSSNPNLQQVPAKMKDIRNLFVAGEGRVFISQDFSKQEVVVCAEACKDKKLIDSLNSGLDVYSQIASIAFNNTYEDNLEFYPDGATNKEGKARRSQAKAVTLGVLYSKGVRAIGEDLGISEEKAQEVYDAIMGAFPVMADWIKDTETVAKSLGYVNNLYGRRRRLPDLLLPDYEFQFKQDLTEEQEAYYVNKFTNLIKRSWGKEAKAKAIHDIQSQGVTVIDNTGAKAKAGREIVNSIIQSSSADITKKAMVDIYGDKRLNELDCRIELTIHDELIVSCPIENANEVAERVGILMCSAGGNMEAKLKTDCAITYSWGGDEINLESR